MIGMRGWMGWKGIVGESLRQCVLHLADYSCQHGLATPHGRTATDADVVLEHSATCLCREKEVQRNACSGHSRVGKNERASSNESKTKVRADVREMRRGLPPTQPACCPLPLLPQAGSPVLLQMMLRNAVSVPGAVLHVCAVDGTCVALCCAQHVTEGTSRRRCPRACRLQCTMRLSNTPADVARTSFIA
jgi:hypothetical protein